VFQQLSLGRVVWKCGKQLQILSFPVGGGVQVCALQFWVGCHLVGPMAMGKYDPQEGLKVRGCRSSLLLLGRNIDDYF
jgi:hypothetical protein